MDSSWRSDQVAPCLIANRSLGWPVASPVSDWPDNLGGLGGGEGGGQFVLTQQHFAERRVRAGIVGALRERVAPEAGREYYRRISIGYQRGLSLAVQQREVRDLDAEDIAYALMGIAHFVALRWMAQTVSRMSAATSLVCCSCQIACVRSRIASAAFSARTEAATGLE